MLQPPSCDCLAFRMPTTISAGILYLSRFILRKNGRATPEECAKNGTVSVGIRIRYATNRPSLCKKTSSTPHPTRGTMTSALDMVRKVATKPFNGGDHL